MGGPSIMDKLIKLIQFYEGYRGLPYQDTKGLWTFGYGRCYQVYPFTINERSLAIKLVGIEESVFGNWTTEYTTNVLRNLTPGNAHELAEYSIIETLDEIVKRIKDFSWFQALDPVRRAVWIDLSYNMGLGTVLKFSESISLCIAEEYGKLADYMLRWPYAIQVGRNPPTKDNPRGQRAWINSEMMRNGEWPSWL